jgi:hypothetical protein
MLEPASQPAPMATTRPGAVIWTGTALDVSLPSPSWPKLSSPQAQILPVLVSARLCVRPAARVTIRTLRGMCTNAGSR